MSGPYYLLILALDIFKDCKKTGKLLLRQFCNIHASFPLGRLAQNILAQLTNL